MSLVNNSSELEMMTPSKNNFEAFAGSYKITAECMDSTSQEYQRNELYIPLSLLLTYADKLSNIFFKCNNLETTKITNYYDFFDNIYRQTSTEVIIRIIGNFDIDNPNKESTLEIETNTDSINENLSNYRSMTSDILHHAVHLYDEHIEYFIKPSWDTIKPYLMNFGHIILVDALPDLNSYTACAIEDNYGLELQADYRIFRQFKDKLLHYGYRGDSLWTIILNKYYSVQGNQYISIEVDNKNKIEIKANNTFPERIKNYLIEESDYKVILYKGNLTWHIIYNNLDAYNFMDAHKLRAPIIVDAAAIPSESLVIIQSKNIFQRIWSYIYRIFRSNK